MIIEIEKYVALFFIYSFLGWSIEVFREFQSKKHFVNRGFLIGPICPIYGVGGVLMLLTLSKYKDAPIVLFCMSIIIFSILEYFTSYIMEKLFKARWWDYSNNKYNLNGRICAETMIPFGLLGMFVIYILNPLLIKLLSYIPSNIIMIVAIILVLIFVIDYIFSFNIILGFKGTLLKLEKDSTEEITRKVKDKLLKGNYLNKRLIKAFPNLMETREHFKYRKEKIIEELKKYI